LSLIPSTVKQSQKKKKKAFPCHIRTIYNTPHWKVLEVLLRNYFTVASGGTEKVLGMVLSIMLGERERGKLQ
jgi:hypothetical protein